MAGNQFLKISLAPNNCSGQTMLEIANEFLNSKHQNKPKLRFSAPKLNSTSKN